MNEPTAVADRTGSDVEDAVRLLREAADAVRRLWQASLDGASIDEVARLAEAGQAVNRALLALEPDAR